MTPTLKEQLEQWIVDMSYAYECPVHRNCYGCCQNDSDYEKAFKSGAHSILPMLVVALEALNQYGQSSVYVGSEDCNISVAYNALNKIKSMMEGNGND